MYLNCHARQKRLEDATLKAIADVNHPNTEVKTSNRLGQRPWILGLVMETLGAYGGRGEVCTWFWWGNLRERDHWGDPDVDGRIILRWIFRKWEGVVGTGWSWLRIRTFDGHV